MRVFITGCTGFIGAAIARALVARGHHVTGLVRPGSRGTPPPAVEPCPGDLRLPATYLPRAAASDAFIHAAYEYDAAGGEVPEADAMACTVMLELIRDHAVPCTYTSNAFLLDDPACADADEFRPLPARLLDRQPRLHREIAVTSAGAAAIRVGVVYGGSGGTMAMLLDALAGARDFDALDGLDNRWSLVHVEDLAALYCTVAEQRARGVFHGVDGRPLHVSDVVALTRAALAARPRARQLAHGAAAALLRNYRHVLGRDIALRPVRSRQLGWAPRHTSYHEGAARAVADWDVARKGMVSA